MLNNLNPCGCYMRCGSSQAIYAVSNGPAITPCNGMAGGQRASPSAAQGRTGARPLRGRILDRPAPARTDELHRVRLPAAGSADIEQAAQGSEQPPDDGATKRRQAWLWRRSRLVGPDFFRPVRCCPARRKYSSSSYLTLKCPGSAKWCSHHLYFDTLMPSGGVTPSTLHSLDRHKRMVEGLCLGRLV